MDDLIKRSDAIKHFKAKADHYRKRLANIKAQGDAISYDPTDQIKGFEDEIAIYEDAAKQIEDIPPAEKQGEWIPCSERLPEENGKSYLTFQCGDDSRYGWCQVLRYDDGWNCLNGDKENEIKCVVAWMPLPEPWEGAEEGET